MITISRILFHLPEPMIAGFVIEPEVREYSSARDFVRLRGLIELNFS